VKALALSLINYCSLIWGVTYKTQLDRVQKLQNFAIRVAVGARKFDHITPLFEQLQCLKIEDMCHYDLCISVFKVLRQHFPNWLCTLPTVGQERHVRLITRQQDDLVILRANTEYGKRSFLIIGPREWNSLPTYIKDIGSLPVFKKKLKDFMLNK